MRVVDVAQPDLFAPAWPEGLTYQRDFLSADEERWLLQHIEQLPLTEASYKSYTARRRVVSFGGRYDYDALQLQPAAPIPEFLYPLRERVAAQMAVAPAQLQHALVSEYRPGTPLGWHRRCAGLRTHRRRFPGGHRDHAISALSAASGRQGRIYRTRTRASLDLSDSRRRALELATPN